VTEASARSLRGLNVLNFSVAFMQAGFGTFIAVRLAAAGWNDGDIGRVLAAGLVAQMIAQVPSGAAIDRLRAKRALAAMAISAIAAAALTMALTDSFIPVLIAQVVQGAAAVGLSVAIAALTLSLCPQSALGERLGKNVRYAAIGAAAGSGLLGLAGGYLTLPVTFALAAAAGCIGLLSLASIRPAELADGHTRSTHRTVHFHSNRPHPTPLTPFRKLLRSRALLVLMAVIALFQIGNAMLFNLAAIGITRMEAMSASTVVGAVGIGSQAVNAMLSPQIGRWAQNRGRVHVLSLGLLALPVRALLFAAGGPSWLTLLEQLLDGVSAATVGVMLPLIVADITHRGGRFNMALGMVGLVSSVGAVLGTVAGGNLAYALGLPSTFLILAGAGAAAVVMAATRMPETAHLPMPVPAAPGHAPVPAHLS
jgi:MFS family permease